MGDKTREALQEFQRRKGLPVTGELDPDTEFTLLATSVKSALGRGPAKVPDAVPVPKVSSRPLSSPSSQISAPDPKATVGPTSSSAPAAKTIRAQEIKEIWKPNFWLLLLAGLAFMWWLRRREKKPKAASVPQGIARSRATQSPPSPPGNDLPSNLDFDPPYSSNSAGSRSKFDGLSNWQATPASKKDRRLKNAWIPSGQSVTVAGRNIGGMVYVGRAPSSERTRDTNNAYIDPSMRVDKLGDDFAGDGMSYWPSYANISRKSRATYLDWLSSGRSDPEYNVGYIFLYFYGLEHRFFQDEPDPDEKQEIVEEVERLLGIYGDNGSVRRYFGNFLEAARLLVDDQVRLAPVYERTGYETPIVVRLGIGHLVSNDEPIPANWMLSWLVTHPERWLRTPAKRAFEEFRALFEIRFNERYPDGLKLTKPKRKLSVKYHAASGNFISSITGKNRDLPDVSGLRKPLDLGWEIVESATDDLDKFSRYLGRNPEGRGTIEAHALLPDALKPLFPCPELDALKEWATERIQIGGIVPLADLIERLEGARPDKIGKRQLTGAADALANLGIGMAPDPRFALRNPKFEEPVVLFNLPAGVVALEEVSPGYQSALLAITLGSFIAHADGSVSELERHHLEERIHNTPGLSASEQARLRANIDWMMAVPPDLTFLRRRLKDTDQEVRADLGKVALAVAGSDGHIDPAEINAIQKLYSALGLEADGIYGELHALTSSGGPVTVFQPETVGTEFAIPPAPIQAAVPSSVALDQDRIAAIMSDTARVSGVLHTIFADEEAEDEEIDVSASETAVVDDGRFEGLDAKHRALVEELLSSDEWSEEDFARLAGQFGLMSAGALETINEWSFGRFDDALLEEDEMLLMNAEITPQLAA
tara:strand:+ start:3618 stop:6254 length:2637 start_codon:yes stop_codon:yes gene_type:complete